jgi:hypothetical protein
MQRNNGLEFPKSVIFSQSLVPSLAAFHVETALLHNSETYMKISTLESNSCKVGEVRSFVHAPPWIFQ